MKMRILHYFLGFPPYRSGGLTKYAVDLMTSQIENGDKIFALWPGSMPFFSDKVKIVERKSIYGISNFELINPLPVPLDEGIIEIDKYTKQVDSKVYIEFLTHNKIDVIHVHTLMGIHKAFFEAARELDIRTVFSTHDYFGICPKVNLCCNGKVCSDNECATCYECNQSALSIGKIRILQSPLYRFMKQSKLVSLLRKQHRMKYFSEEENSDVCANDLSATMSQNYLSLRKHYLDMLNAIDVVHCNSSVTENIYKQYVNSTNICRLNITHSSIQDNRTIKEFDDACFKLTFLGSARTIKGYYVIKRALDNLWENGIRNFRLNLYTSVENPSPYMVVHQNGYQYQELEAIFDNTDLLLAPSVGYETFGFTVLEALSFGVPVLVSDNVGAKDIVQNGGMIVEAASVDAIESAIASLTVDQLKDYNNYIVNSMSIQTWKDFVKENDKLYRR